MLILTFLPFTDMDAAITTSSAAEMPSKSIMLTRNRMLKSQPSQGSPTLLRQNQSNQTSTRNVSDESSSPSPATWCFSLLMVRNLLLNVSSNLSSLNHSWASWRNHFLPANSSHGRIFILSPLLQTWSSTLFSWIIFSGCLLLPVLFCSLCLCLKGNAALTQGLLCFLLMIFKLQ